MTDLPPPTALPRPASPFAGTVGESMPSAPMGYSMVQEGLQIGESWGTDVAPQFFRGAFPFSGELRVVEMRTDRSAQSVV